MSVTAVLGAASARKSQTPTTISQTGTRMKPKNPSGVTSDAPMTIVAQASQTQLDAGRRFCFLYTDLANPTANHIYTEIGYQPVRDVSVVRFG